MIKKQSNITRLAKVAAEKQAFAGLVGAGIGGAVGAANLPNDATSADRARYASQGALRGGGLGTGASVGAGLGYLGSKALMKNQDDPSSLRTTIATLLPFLTGAAGGTLGYDIGDQFARNPGFALDSKSSAGDEVKADKREERMEKEKRGFETPSQWSEKIKRMDNAIVKEQQKQLKADKLSRRKSFAAAGAAGGGALVGGTLANLLRNKFREEESSDLEKGLTTAAGAAGGGALGYGLAKLLQKKAAKEKKAGMIGGLLGGGAFLAPMLGEYLQSEKLRQEGAGIEGFPFKPMSNEAVRSTRNGLTIGTGVTALAGSQVEELIRKAFRGNSERREEEEKQGGVIGGVLGGLGGAGLGVATGNALEKQRGKMPWWEKPVGITATGTLAGLAGSEIEDLIRSLIPEKKKSEKEAALKGLVLEKIAESAAWQRKAGKNSEGGLNAKGRASYNKSTGGNLKAPVTSKKPKGKAKKRKASFCARMGGMKKKNTSKATANDPDSRINKSLRKWNC